VGRDIASVIEQEDIYTHVLLPGAEAAKGTTEGAGGTEAPAVELPAEMEEQLAGMALSGGDSGGDSVGSSRESSKYMVGVVAEYIRTLNHHRLVVTPIVMRFLVQLLAGSGRFYELHQFIQYKVVHDAEAVAEQLLTLQDRHPASFQSSLDVPLRRKKAKGKPPPAVMAFMQRRREAEKVLKPMDAED